MIVFLDIIAHTLQWLSSLFQKWLPSSAETSGDTEVIEQTFF